ncbi:MAG: ferrous iron transport protein B, partial [Selenomonadaceae bacterium]
GIPSLKSAEGMGTLVGILGASGFGALNAYALMVFCLLYVPCAATLATIKRESGSWSWTVMSAGFQFSIAWILTYLVYHGGRMIFA